MMESHYPVATFQDPDNGTGQVATDCLHVSVILRAIFQHFSTAELLQLALVSKFWSYEARSLLRHRGSVALIINKTKTCTDLRALASALRQSKAVTRVLPFSGLTINLHGLYRSHAYLCKESSTGELDQVCEEILGQITWKSLAVKFDGQWTKEFTNCSGFLLVKKLLEQFAFVLEELTLEFHHDHERGDILPQVFRSCSFPRLAVLRIKHSGCAVESVTHSTKIIVSHAPNLKLLETSHFLNLRENLLEGSSAVHITSHPYSAFENEIPEDSVGTFRMTRMDETIISEDFQLDRFNRITSGLLAVSRTTLTTMHIDVLFLVTLTTNGICLENVRKLKMNLNEPEVDDPPPPHPGFYRLVKSFDFTRILPNLKDVTLNCYSEFEYYVDGIHEMVERANASYVEPMPDRAANIKNLSLETSWAIEDSGVPLYAEMFPDVEVLSIQGFEIPIGRICESWPKLKGLDVIDTFGSVVQNLDGIFCGIFPTEVAQLQEQDEEYLRKVNIVPVMPSITCLEDLKTLNFIFGKSTNVPRDDPTYLFSKVTGLIAFQRCPALSVTLTVEDERRQEALSHVRPYATILLKATF